MSTLLEQISNHPLFEGLDPEHVAKLSESGMAVDFPAGTVIFQEGDPANRFYLILTGAVVLESDIRDEENPAFQTLGPGEVLGWSWMFPPYYWHFTARAVEPVKAIFFYGTRLREYCETHPDLGYALMKRVSNVLIDRLQNARRQLIKLHAEIRKAAGSVRAGTTRTPERDVASPPQKEP
jgi:CRP/FNR family transcriptional regulator, cyclic AMP receptor protein